MTIRKPFRVLLIKPPIEGFHALTVGSRHAPTGLMYLAHALAKEGVEAEIFDCLIFTEDTHLIAPDILHPMGRKKAAENPVFRHILHVGAGWDRIARKVADFQPDLVGISVLFSPYHRAAYRTAEIIRRVCPRAKILFGGPHATVATRHVFDHSPCDAVVLGEGETTFARLSADLLREGAEALVGMDVSQYPGLCLRKGDGEIAENRNRSFIGDLDGLGFPAMDRLDLTPYQGIVSLITSRGCPFSCSFCSVHQTVGSTFRMRSVENVMEEIRYYVKRGIKTFNIEDDNFTFNIGRVDALMEAIRREDLGITIQLPNGITALNMNNNRLHGFAEAGVRQLFFGLESVDKGTRKLLKKSFANLEDIQNLVHHARKEKLFAFASLITGLPHQDPADMAREIAEVFQRGIGAIINPYYPIPETSLWAEVKARGGLPEEDAEWYEPMNFPYQGEKFTRKHSASAFFLGHALAHPDFSPFHRRFLQAENPPSLEEVRTVLAQLGMLMDFHPTGEMVVAPTRCFCDSQHLEHKHVGDPDFAQGHGVCAFSGQVLNTVLELWLRRPYANKELRCCVTQEVDQCLFGLMPRGGDMDEIIGLFLDHIKRAQTGAEQPLPVTYESQALGARKAYMGLGY